jgi:hypothetical protein
VQVVVAYRHTHVNSAVRANTDDGNRRPIRMDFWIGQLPGRCGQQTGFAAVLTRFRKPRISESTMTPLGGRRDLLYRDDQAIYYLLDCDPALCGSHRGKEAIDFAAHFLGLGRQHVGRAQQI